MPMTPQLQIVALDQDTRQYLKLVIKQLVREMVVEAIEGRLELPDGMDSAEQELKRRLVILDAALNPSGSI